LNAQRERALVGLFVLVAAGLLVLTLFSLTGVFERDEPVYRAFFKNAGGLAPGSQVRYAGGPPVGRVVSVRMDPDNPARLQIDFRVERRVPVKTDSKVKIASLSPLSDNFLGIVPGSDSAPRAPSGSELASEKYVSFDDLEAQIGNLAPQASTLVGNLNARAADLQLTIQRVNELLNSRNRANIAASLANARGMLAEDRPPLHAALNNLSQSSAKLGPLLGDFKSSVKQANVALSHVDSAVTENRADLRQSVEQMRAALTSASALAEQLNDLMNANADDLSDVIQNVRDITMNLKAFTGTIRNRPSAIIRTSAPADHVSGQVPKHPN
jgi:phospholipid/cholesterol/gamma-HCH transport system substrate-binding protein